MLPNNKKTVSPGVFAEFVPTHTLPAGDRFALAKSSHVLQYEPGQMIFQRGETAATIAYLLAGEVELVNEAGIRLVSAATEDARHPLSAGTRNSCTASAVRPSQILFVDRDQMDVLLTWAQTGAVEVKEIDAGDPGDWMSVMLCNPLFQRIPPANIAQVIACIEIQEVASDQVIIGQGDAGDYYYVLISGICEVLRTDASGQPQLVDRFGSGRGFGEEALVSEEPRNATVRVAESGSVARLAAVDFSRLLRDPLLERIALVDRPANGLLIDVRLPEEFARGHLQGALNVPLRSLRGEATTMATDKPLVVYCDTGRRSASAAFLFRERGFNALLVDGGVDPELLLAT